MKNLMNIVIDNLNLIRAGQLKSNITIFTNTEDVMFSHLSVWSAGLHKNYTSDYHETWI